MNIQLTSGLRLTNERAECQYGIPVLVTSHDDQRVYGPADIVDAVDGLRSAAYLVALHGKDLRGEERRVAKLFLSQWPGGPRLTT